MILILDYLGMWNLESSLSSSSDRLSMRGSILTNFSLTAAWGWHEVKSSWNGPAWSLSAEWFNYLIFPLVPLLLSVIKSVKGYFILIILLWIHFYIVTKYNGVGLFFDYGLGGILRSLTGFVIGACLAKIYQKEFNLNINWDKIFVATLFSFIVILEVNYRFYKLPLSAFYILLPVLLFSLLKSEGKVKGFFSQKICLYLGRLAFAIYMLHQPVLRLITHFGGSYYQMVSLSGNQVLKLTQLTLCLSIIIILAALAYHFVEKPCQNYLRRKIKIHSKNN